MRNSEAEVTEMKKASLLVKAGATAGSIAAIIGLLSQVWPPIWEWLAASELKTIETQAAKIATLESKVQALNELADGALDASEDRFVENEKHAIELRGSLEMLRHEVRLRHGDSGGVPTPQPVASSRAGASRRPASVLSGGLGNDPLAGLGGSAPPPAPARRRPPSRREQLAMIADETDARLSAARIETPKQMSLRDAIEKRANEAPFD